MHCYHADEEEITAAHEEGLSCGKYRAYLELKKLDPDVTVDEVRGMTMREIRERIETLSPGQADPSEGSTAEQEDATAQPADGDIREEKTTENTAAAGNSITAADREVDSRAVDSKTGDKIRDITAAAIMTNKYKKKKCSYD